MTSTLLCAPLEHIYEQAHDIAQQTGRDASTAHVLFALFVLPNDAERLLMDRGINEETLLASLTRFEDEPRGTYQNVRSAAAGLAADGGRSEISCLDLLASLASTPQAFAYRLLRRAGVELPTLRETALRYARDGLPTRLRTGEAAMAQLELRGSEQRAEGLPMSGFERVTAAFNALEDAEHGDDDRDTAIDLPIVGAQTVQAPSLGRQGTTSAGGGSRGADNHDKRRHGDRRATPRGRRRSDRKKGDRGRQKKIGTSPNTAAEQIDEGPFALPADSYPCLTQLGVNLSHRAWQDGFDPVVGRSHEIEQTIDILNKRRSNNPCLIGEPGVGKTAIVEGVASQMVAFHGESEDPPERIIVQVDVGAILAGTHLRGALAERLRGLQDEVRKAEGRVVVFIDEIHTLIGSGGGDGAHDAANELKAALARGEFPCIGATTIDEFRTHVESDAALERRFTTVTVEEPDEADTLTILQAVADRYSEHHGVEYEDDALVAAVRLGRRYLHERRDPDRALGILDLAGAVSRRAGHSVNRRAVAEVIARGAKVPVDHLMVDDPERFLQLESRLSERIIGQRHILAAIGETIRRNFAGFSGQRPIGSFLFLGPTGVGKTEAVKALAAELFGHREAMVRFDMSEFVEAHAVARLIGAPPGYVGHNDGGQLTDRIRRRPYQVVLFDEIEKSHREIWNVLLQILDDGRLTDGKGRTVDFTNTLVVMTSNLGAGAFATKDRRIGFAGAAESDTQAMTDRALREAKGQFPAELWNRIETRLVFHPLSRDEVHAIAHLLLVERSDLLHREREIRFSVTDAVIDFLIENGGYDQQLGARPMRQTIAREIESPLAAQILKGDIVSGGTIHIDFEDGGLVFAPSAPTMTLPATTDT